MFINIFVLFLPVYNYSIFNPSMQNKQNSGQQSKSSQKPLFMLQALIKDAINPLQLFAEKRQFFSLNNR